MRKLFKLSLILLLPFTINAQDLITKVPANATAVAKVNTSNFFNYISQEEFNQSFLGKSFLDKAFSDSTLTLKEVQNFGINFSVPTYYFYQQTDSIGYNVLLVPLQDANKLESFFGKKNNIIKTGDLRKLISPDSSSVVLWNKDVLYFVNAHLKDNFFADTTNAKRYGIEQVRYSYDDDTVAVDSAVVEDITIIPVDTIATAPATEEEMEEGDEKEEENDDRYDAYYKKLDEQQAKKKKLKFSWLEIKANEFYNAKFTSINTNSDYLKNADDNALASFWMGGDIASIYQGFLPTYLAKNYSAPFNAYKNISAHLFADDKNFKLNISTEVREAEAEIFAKIYKHKLNKKFLNYVDSDKAIGAISYAVNTEAYLNEIPKLMMMTYGSILGNTEDEAALGADLLSLFIDEKAIAKVFKGDALFVINDLTTREVPYTTYEYDDDYNSIEVQKTKTEALPNFLFMMSSDDTRFFEKLLTIGKNRDKLSLTNNLYKLEVKKDLFDIYFLIKDKIVFCSTSKEDLEKISNNIYQANISKKHKDLLMNNNFTAFVSAKNLSDKVSQADINRAKLLTINKTLNQMGDIQIKSNGIKGNLITAEIISEIPNGQQNAIKYLFSLVENAQVNK